MMIDQIAEGLLDQIELIKIRVAGQQRLTRVQLAEHATYRPDVHRRTVLGIADEQLGRSVPSRRHILCEILILYFYNNNNNKNSFFCVSTVYNSSFN